MISRQRWCSWLVGVSLAASLAAPHHALAQGRTSTASVSGRDLEPGGRISYWHRRGDA